MKITHWTRERWFLSGGPYIEVLYRSGVDIVGSPIIVTRDRWYLCSSGHHSRFHCMQRFCTYCSHLDSLRIKFAKEELLALSMSQKV